MRLVPSRLPATSRLLLVGLPALLLTGVCATPAGAGGAAVLSGTAFEDVDRDGTPDAGEPRLAGHRLELTSTTGQSWSATADAEGRYAFSVLADGLYRLDVESGAAAALRDDWVPTTGTGLLPYRNVQLSGAATAHVGWRRIVRSTDRANPLSVFTGPSGLRVESYDDVVPARELHDALASGLLTGEAPTTTVAFDLGATSSTSSSFGQDADGYGGFAARSSVTWASWRDRGPETLAHEHGHAWGSYHAAITQQDPSLTSYLRARGLAGDPRLRTSYAWMPDELLAEDYRQLLGPAAAAAAPQVNRDLPRAADVPGLREFLTTTFVTPVARTSAPPATPLAVDRLTVTTSRRGTEVGFRASEAGTVDVRVLDAGGRLVRTLLTGPVPAGTTTVLWDGKDAAGRRVKTAGASVLVVLTSSGRTASASTRLG